MWDTRLDLEQATLQDMIPLVNQAFKRCHSVLALSRSPLASSRIVQPAFIRDDASPTAEERSHALLLALRWALSKLAPTPVDHPIGDYRPLDDPTWSDPRWWRYNILRHRYLEPLHPDDFVEDGRFTETIVALTGIPSHDAYFDERNRAIQEATQWLRRQLHEGIADTELARLALHEIYEPLQRDRTLAQLMEIAATFDAIFSRQLLLKLAEAEGLVDVDHLLDRLIQRRDLLSDLPDRDGRTTTLWMGPALQRYIYARSDDAERRMRHGRIARALEKGGEALAAARHYRLSEQPVHAAELLLNALEQATTEVGIDNLLAEIQALSKAEVPTDLRYRLTTWAADLYRIGGDNERAIAACRTALEQSTGRAQQGQIYRRLAKLYEQRNQSHALTYYRQALDRLEPEDKEIAELLKDRGWLHLLRRDWTAAEQDLTAALARRSPDDVHLEADIYDALSSLARRQRDFAQATEHARTALSLRESQGDRLGVAKSLGNLGLIYNDQGEYAHAIAAFEEAAATYDRLGNRELSLTARLNVGLAQHLGGSLDNAISTYQRCLAEGQELGNQLAVVMTHSNLAEAFAQQGTAAAARRHWLDGFALSKRHGLDDEIEYYVELSTQFEALAELPKQVQRVVAADPPVAAVGQSPLLPTEPAAQPSTPAGLDPAEKAAWKLAQDAGSVTAKDVMEAAQVSKPTATRKLAGLVERGLLRKEGQGRGTRYVPVAVLEAPDSPLAQRLATERSFLAQTHGVTALAVAPPAPDLPTAARLIARFETLPDLHAFFALENELAILCATPLRLLPESAFTPPTASTQLQWLWAEEGAGDA